MLTPLSNVVFSKRYSKGSRAFVGDYFQQHIYSHLSAAAGCAWDWGKLNYSVCSWQWRSMSPSATVWLIHVILSGVAQRDNIYQALVGHSHLWFWLFLLLTIKKINSLTPASSFSDNKRQNTETFPHSDFLQFELLLWVLCVKRFKITWQHYPSSPSKEPVIRPHHLCTSEELSHCEQIAETPCSAVD